MAEYIDREALIAKFKRLKLGENSFVERVFADGVYAIIEQFPAADVAPVVHGRWIRKPHWCVSCSYCGKCTHDYEGEVESYNYCPNCGAKMDERDGDNA